MKKILLLLSLIVHCFVLYSQEIDFEKPDYKKIKKNIAKENSNLYYPKLFERFTIGDSLFTLREKRHLYYGYSFQKDYSPYGYDKLKDSLRVFNEMEEHDSSDLSKIITISDSILANNPFDLRTLNFQLYALEKTKEFKKFNKRLSQIRLIFDALLSSGNGMSKKEAFYVIYTSHEYDMLNILGFRFGGEQSLVDHYDYLKVVENEAKIDGLYFDVSPCLKSLSNKFK